MADQGGHIRRRQAIVLAAALMITPLGAQGADLVMRWEEGSYPQEDEAAAEIIVAFEQATAKQVELACHKQADLAEAIAAALEMNQPPRLRVRYAHR